ncbi:Histone-lysine N-methyltransferase, H3 lysine-79 specific [Mycena indigotica]|uniref:Histone-lysine N-methyltransferase, H3 lysine-79 specific n=1 Tax=Mycena indigotica TaxID=2126181 RepID=A0A8H6SUY7_9AGAR|nr:Histone-lysine N-methyltransferase, H3 lysine-79 specific [Mycena indigotica]KAF7306373.1 Histone-lysine N-methyltransferase, H3 lysine-79 specific [Mycena indigotica]
MASPLSPHPPTPMAIVATSNAEFFSGRPLTTPTTVTVTTRVVQRTLPSPASSPLSRPPKSQSSSPLSTPPTSSPMSSPIKKRKSVSLGASADLDMALPREAKRVRREKAPKRVSSAPRLVKRASSSSTLNSASPEPRFRGSRSRSVSHFATPDDAPVQKRHWVAKGDALPHDDFFSSEDAVRMHLRTYRGYFKNYQDPSDRSFQQSPNRYPTVELEYPNRTASEKYILLAPVDKDHYNPIMDVEKTLYTIVENYLTPAQQALFGPIPSGTLFIDLDETPPSISPPNSTDSSRSISSDLNSSPTRKWQGPKPNVLRAVQRAIHRKDGPAFMEAMEKANNILRGLKYPQLTDVFMDVPNLLMNTVQSWTDKELPKNLLMRVVEENYQRSVGPYMQSLKQYEAFSSAVYGELTPSLIYKIVRQTGLNSNSLFIDLGSGVGNIVVQASLQSGCHSYGVELNRKPAKIAAKMVKSFQVRARMWGLECGKVEVEEGDMITSPHVHKLLSQADVVLINNKIFPQTLNEQLRPKFLDLKEGAYVVSLAPFVPSLNGRVTERNLDDISTIFEVKEFPYHSGDVSWGSAGGSYYVHRVDRKGYAAIRAELENSSRTSSRSSRRRS